MGLLISSLKRITGIKPIRVWKRESVDGAMILALLAEAAVAMARYCMEGEDVEDTDMEGNRIVRKRRPSTESIVRSLSYLTLTIYRRGKGRYESVLSNWEPVSTEIMGIIRAHETPEWDDRKVPFRPISVRRPNCRMTPAPQDQRTLWRSIPFSCTYARARIGETVEVRIFAHEYHC